MNKWINILQRIPQKTVFTGRYQAYAVDAHRFLLLSTRTCETAASES